MEGVFTCSEIKESFAGAGLWRHGCEQNVNGEKSLCFGAVLTSRFERFSLSLALRLPYIQIILDLCKVVNRKTVGGVNLPTVFRQKLGRFRLGNLTNLDSYLDS